MVRSVRRWYGTRIVNRRHKLLKGLSITPLKIIERLQWFELHAMFAACPDVRTGHLAEPDTVERKLYLVPHLTDRTFSSWIER